jgi:peptidoglycan L-alanyl-D-glutamate endopeptidase CwlK
MSLNTQSIEKLGGVHPHLVQLVYKASELSDIPFIITEGLRTIEKQRLLVAKGASRTMKSRHLTGHAVDVAAIIGNDVRWDWPLYKTIADAFKAASVQLNIPIEWGGDWRTFKDGCHFQLPWKDYP